MPSHTTPPGADHGVIPECRAACVGRASVPSMPVAPEPRQTGSDVCLCLGRAALAVRRSPSGSARLVA
jgi:hypothetical protein